MHPERCSYYRLWIFERLDTDASVKFFKSHKYNVLKANKFLLI